MITPNEIKFRCSALGNILTDARSKTETLSETCKSYLIDLMVDFKYGRREEVKNDFVDKGTLVEQESIRLLSLHTMKKYTKNKERLSNDFITGEPDIILPNEVIDIKSSFSAHTFFRAQKKDLNKMYFAQIQGYMALTGLQKGSVVYCLTNSPAYLIGKEISRLAYRYEPESKEWRKSAMQVERNHIFNIAEFKRVNPDYELVTPLDEWMFNIPTADRVFKFEVERDNELIQKIYDRAQQCRDYLKHIW